jgi:primase-polymerase (primpol)-like protein
MSPRPLVSQVNFSSIPTRLRSERRWCVWALQWKRQEDTWAKVPMAPDGSSWLKWSDRKLWLPFDGAREAYERSRGGVGCGHDGVGFFLGDGFGGIDLDGVVLEDGALTNEAGRIVRELDTYVELSPRGRGPKMFYLGSAPTLTPTPLSGGGTIESYSSGHFFTITGNRIEGSRDEPQERSQQATAIVEAIAPRRTAPGNLRAPMSEDEIRDLVRNYTDGTRHVTRNRLLGHLVAKDVSTALAEEFFVILEQAAAIVQQRSPTPPDTVRKKVAAIYAKHALGLINLDRRCSEEYALIGPLEET